MSKDLISVAKALKPAIETTKEVVTNELGRTTFIGIDFHNGLKLGFVARVGNMEFKHEYREILNILVNICKFPKKLAAEICGVSYLYATKLLRQK